MAGVAEHLKGLEGRPKGEESEKNRPREFFWDSIVLFVVFAIIGLTAVDVISEFVRGSSVQCFAVLDNLGSTTDPESYINNFCSSSLPVSEYFPVFMIVHGILIGIPHYLWLNHYGGSFEFFFQLTSSLERLRDEQTGEYAKKNYITVEQLEAAFATYKRNWIFLLYVAKLILQWFLTVAGLIVAIVFFTDFNENFLCPRTLNETFDNLMWPLPGQQANCVFTSLRLIELLRIADLILLAVVVLGLSWSLIWCASTHSSELGSKDVAVFAFQSGLAPKYHVPKFPVPKCFKGCRNVLHSLFTSIPWLSLHGPRIRTDLDFMVMKLFRTDGGLGHVLREVQILKEIKSLSKDERRIFHLHKREHLTGESGDLISKEDAEADLKWTFENIQDGVYDSYMPWPISDKLVVPDSIRGAVLGYASRSASNLGALYITFGSPSLSFAEALGRVFDKIGCFNFSPYYNNPDEHVKVDDDFEGIVSVLCAEDYLTGDTEDSLKKLLNKSRGIWKDHQSSFILIGAVDKKSHRSTVNFFLDRLSKDHKIAKDAILLYVHPLEIAGKTVENEFYSYTPPKKHFTESDNHRVKVLKYVDGVPVKDMPWYAVDPDTIIKEIEQPETERSTSQKCCCFSQGESSSLLLEEVMKEGQDKHDKLSAVHEHSLLVGDAHGRFRFSLYKRRVASARGNQGGGQPDNSPGGDQGTSGSASATTQQATTAL